MANTPELLESMVCGCLVCGNPEVGVNIQASPEGKVVALIYLCREHMAEAPYLSIVRTQLQ